MMPSNNNTTPNTMIFSARQSLIPAISRRRKLRNPGIAVGLRHRLTQKKHSQGNSSSFVSFWQDLQKTEVSVRKLAAGLWQCRFMKLSRHRGDVFRHAPLFPPSTNQLESSMPCQKCSREEATKWNPPFNNEASDMFTMNHGMKHLEDHKIAGDSYFGVNNLLQLLHVQSSINKLKATHKSSKKRAEQLLQTNNLEDKNVLWKCRQCHKIEKMLHDLKNKLARERRSRERMELLNSKLVNELSQAKFSTKKYMTSYKKEKKERKLIEEVCNELAMQVREDAAKLKRLLSDSVRICEEVEEEREMMEMLELMREERVQMKLADAQFFLQGKYNQMVQLIAFLQMFLRSRGAELDCDELEDAQLIEQAVESVNIKHIVELSYDFSKPDYTLSVLEELRKENMEEGVVNLVRERVAGISLNGEEVLNKSSILHQNSPSKDYNIGLEQTNCSETIGYIEEQKFSSLPQRGETYPVNVNKDKYILGSEEAEFREKACLKSLRTRVNVGTTISSRKSSQHKRVGDGRNIQKECNYRVPTSSIQNAGTSSQM